MEKQVNEELESSDQLQYIQKTRILNENEFQTCMKY